MVQVAVSRAQGQFLFGYRFAAAPLAAYEAIPEYSADAATWVPIGPSTITGTAASTPSESGWWLGAWSVPYLAAPAYHRIRVRVRTLSWGTWMTSAVLHLPERGIPPMAHQVKTLVDNYVLPTIGVVPLRNTLVVVSNADFAAIPSGDLGTKAIDLGQVPFEAEFVSSVNGQTGAVTAGDMHGANNLAEITNGPAARTNLGLGSMATQLATTVAITGGSITGMPTPTGTSDVAIKGYVDATAQGLSAKLSAQAAATVSLTLSGTQTVDGVALVAGNRLLATAQATASQNGLWVVASGAWTRPTDFATASTQTGSYVFISGGTVNGSSGWVLANGPVTVGTTAQTWTQFSGAGEVIAGTGLSKTGNTLAAVFGTTSGTITQGNDSRVTGAAQKAANLSDLASAATARTNLGLGGAAVENVGTVTGTVAAGDDSRITGAAQKASNLSDLASVATSLTNLGIALAGSTDYPGVIGFANVPGSSVKYARADHTHTGVAQDELMVNAKYHGAVGDGVTDDTVALNAAIASAATWKIPLFLPSGTYKVSIQSGTTPSRALNATANVHIRGAGRNATSIKLANAQGDYVTIFGHVAGTDVGGFRLEDLTIDQNNTNNQITSTGPLLSGVPRYIAYLTNATTPMSLFRVRVADMDNVNAISASGAVHNLMVRDCWFEYGSSPIDHDHSTIYHHATTSRSLWIEDCRFTSPGSGSNSATTAIETHGSTQFIRGNEIRNFKTGANLTGVGHSTGEGIYFENNSMLDVKIGVQLWSMPYTGGVTTNPALKGVWVRGNYVRLDVAGWSSFFVTGQSVAGIRLSTATASIEDTTVADNVIVFNNGAYVGQATTDSSANGIDWYRPTLDSSIVDRRVSIRHNTVVNALATGIRVSCYGEQFDVSDNKVLNPGRGSSLAGGGLSTGYAVGLSMTGSFTNSRCSRNTLLDNQTTHTMQDAMWLYPLATGNAVNEALANTASGYVGNLLQTHPTNGGWRVGMVTYSAFVNPGGLLGVGSTILDRTTGVTYAQTVAPDGGTWTALPGTNTATDVQTFTANGTWTKPSWAPTTARVTVTCIGGGGGGGAGRRTASGTVASGGGGGGGAGITAAVFTAAQLGATETVTIGAGGAGSAAITVDSTNGGTGGNGGTSSFGALSKARATGGTGGTGGSTTTGFGGSGGLGSAFGGAGGAGSATGAAGGNGSGGGAAGGGAGGGIATTPANTVGGFSATPSANGAVANGGAGTAGGGNGGNATAATDLTVTYGGASGGGGGSNIAGAGGAGGNGCVYGGAGGGGGSSLNGANSGAGGNGSGGIVQVITTY